MKNKLAILWIAMAGYLFSGCTKGWLDVNNNPNAPTQTKADLVFTNAVNVSLSRLAANRIGCYFGGYWASSTSFIGGAPQATNTISNVDFGGIWDGYYDNAYDYKYVVDHAAAEGKPHLVHFSQIMNSLNFLLLVDLYGDIPYAEALQGSGILQPKYTSAKDVYEDLIKRLDAAITGLTGVTVFSERSDIIFGGNTSKWIRFANTLKMRILMRQAYIPGRDAYIIPEINKIVANGGLLQAGEDVTGNPGYIPGTAGKINPFYAVYGYDQNGTITQNNNLDKISKLVETTFKTTVDTFRMKRMMHPIQSSWTTANLTSGAVFNSDNYFGVPLGAQGNLYGQTITSSIGQHLIELDFQASGVKPVTAGQARSRYVMLAAEAFFLAAEAKQRWPAVTLPGSAQSYYEQGVKESFRVTGTDASKATVLLAGGHPDADWSASANKLRTIILQKWISLISYDGNEAWAEVRRSGIPAVPLSLQSSTPTPPVRLPYPLIEQSTNGINMPQGINIFTDRLFWDTL